MESVDPPTAGEERKILFAIRHLPQFVRITSEIAVTKLSDALPIFAPGHPQKITPEDCEKMCDFISLLHRQCVPLGDAKRRASQRFHCSLRTVERLVSVV